MEFTKHTHATVVLSKNGDALLVDPGAYTPNVADLLGDAAAVLITHEHPDHVDAGAVDAALGARPALHVWAPAGVVALLGDHDGRVHPVSAGDTFEAADFNVAVIGAAHGVIHPDLSAVDNVGYLVDGTVFHPGDSYTVPEAPVETLLVPTSGPWAKLSELVDFIRAVHPVRAVQIHDLMLSDVGRASFARFAGQLTGTELITLPDGGVLTV